MDSAFSVRRPISSGRYTAARLWVQHDVQILGQISSVDQWRQSIFGNETRSISSSIIIIGTSSPIAKLYRQP